MATSIASLNKNIMFHQHVISEALVSYTSYSRTNKYYSVLSTVVTCVFFLLKNLGHCLNLQTALHSLCGG